MISESYIKDLLLSMGYIKKNHIYEKFFPSVDCYIKVDLKNRTIIYPEDRGMTISNRTTCNFSAPENFVVLECVTRLFDKGYRPEHLNLEKEWTLGHESKGGRADICVSDQEGNTLFIVECKTYGREYEKEYKNIVNDGGQLFSYWQQERSCKFLVLYASKYEGKQIKWDTESIDCSDDANIVALSQKDDSIKLFKNAHTVSELYSVWDETYEKRFSGDVIFRDDSSAYQIGVKPLRKADLKDFADNNKIVNKFEEILRHNNVSDKENAFNRLVALFICKLVDEIQKDMEEIVDFQYKVGTDTYESLQDRLQRLHKEGMEKFMKEEIFYVPDDYAENLVRQYTGQERKNMIAHLKHTLRILKFYTNNDFAFKDVHNEQLFLQNGKILVEVVQLFEKFRIIGSENLQMLGDLFEQLLSKGFKQNEGQFFTPVPITRFIWNSLPVEKILKTEEGAGLPKIIDYACGAGHFLTEGFEAVSACVKEYGRGSKILYPNFKEMDFKIGVAFAKDASSLKHGKNTDYNMEIEECQNISMREDMETIENILDQVIEARSVVVLSDFSLERQMEIAGEASLEHFEEILDLLLQKQSESDLVVGSVTCYEGTLEDRANRIEQRRQKYSEYEQKCLEEIEQLTKQRDEALEKQEVKK